MSDKKYVGPIAAAKIVALVKAALGKKLDKSGGTITGSLKVGGLINAGNSLEVKSYIDAEGFIHSGLGLLSPSLGLNNDAEEASVYINCSGDNAARITSLGSDGKSHYSRFAVGTPAGDNDAATKAYVDDLAAGHEVIYVDFWGTGSGEEYSGDLKGYVVALASDQTYDAIFDLLSDGKNVVARLYDGSGKTNLIATSVDAQFSGDKTLGIINFLFFHAAETDFNGFPSTGDTIQFVKTSASSDAYVLYKYCSLPVPAGDGTDNGKVPIVNGTKWELKALLTYENGNEVRY